MKPLPETKQGVKLTVSQNIGNEILTRDKSMGAQCKKVNCRSKHSGIIFLKGDGQTRQTRLFYR